MGECLNCLNRHSDAHAAYGKPAYYSAQEPNRVKLLVEPEGGKTCRPQLEYQYGIRARLATPGTPPVPHVGGPIVTGCPTVMIGFMPAARVGDQATCVGPPDVIAMGSFTVMIGGMPAAQNRRHDGARGRSS